MNPSEPEISPRREAELKALKRRMRILNPVVIGCCRSGNLDFGRYLMFGFERMPMVRRNARDVS